MKSAVDDALRLQQIAAAQGFDWPDLRGVWEKVAEEVAELQQARTSEHRREELGDLLFMLVNLARHLGIDSEQALIEANAKFARRWGHIASHLEQLPAASAARLERMEALWQEAKRMEKNLEIRKLDFAPDQGVVPFDGNGTTP